MARKTKQNSITSPELLAQVNPENMNLLNDFIDYMHSLQRSNGTCESYRSDILIAWVWGLQNNNNKFFVDWTKRNIVAYQNWLLTQNENSPARVRRLKAALSSLSNFIENVLDDEFPNFRNIVKKVENPVNQPVREKTVLSEEQVDELLDTLIKRKKYEQACVLALAMCSGRRKAELPRFRVSDFNQDHLVCGGGLYKSDPIKTKGNGAQGKMLNCFTLARKFQPYLDLWLNERKEKGIESEWLFPDHNDPTKQLSPTTLNSWARTFSNIIGEDFYWHCMRHAAVTNLIRAGIPNTAVQQFIGWADVSMVSVYTDIDADEHLSMFFDENGIVAQEKKGFDSL